ncbi:hypothetical protein AKJ09_00428 [Labilithrix luteola]|uniref:Uncharacterized protein n=1 Tax=Labilithrix luteola TaxID=1391654 RepID=A0A0K1PKY8_9BACT|nr:hypothetical protein [Labilithrix luteola]AKU93764.1 hypothetical protein AKJ09_00428 [Labilithrix luteola]
MQQRQVSVVVMATCDYAPSGPMGDPAQLDQHVQQQVLRAIRDVIGRKMANRELTFRHLGTGDVAAVTPEILAVSGLEQNGIRVSSLAMSFGIDGHPPQPPRPAQGAPPAAQQHNLAQGTFDMGGGHQLRVKINGKTPENYLKDKASGMVFGWILGAIIVGAMVLTVVGFGIYIFVVAKSGNAPKAAAAAKWDGKSEFECAGNDAVVLTGVTAKAGVKASGNCQLTMSSVSITAPVAIEAGGNAKVTMTGGSISSSTNSVVASANAKVDLVGTKVTGKAKTSGGAKVTGAP